MLSNEQCRQILGADCHPTEAELAELRDQLYALADIAIVVFLEQRSQKPRTRMTVGAADGVQIAKAKEGKPPTSKESQPKEIHQ